MKHVEIGAVDVEDHGVTGVGKILAGRLCLKAGARDQAWSAAGIGDELREDGALSESVEDTRSLEVAGADASVGVGLGAGDFAADVGIVRGAIDGHLLLR